jgi:S-(hydroxymethyl)glutathione dehydrogenase/alcohol dehydrogenase
VKTKAAVNWGVGQDWKIEDLELDDPKAGEVLVKLAASGLCHSDEHIITGDMPVPAYPYIGGHEGAGVVEKVGPGVTTLKVGDHVVLSFIPACGRCKMCSTGHQNLCDLGAGILEGLQISDGGARHHVKGQDARLMCVLGTFAPYTVVSEASVVKIDDDIPLEIAALVGCGVTTGWGSAVYAAEVGPGDTVVVVGVGGIGMNAVQGARLAGAKNIIAVDPVEFKREQAQTFGATHTAASMQEAFPLIQEITRGVMADKAILTVGHVDGSMGLELMALVTKGGTAVVTGLGSMMDINVNLSLFDLTLSQKRLQGALFGSANPRADIPLLLSLYQAGQLKLDELVTRKYTLEQINEGYQDMRDGKNIRGVVVYS